VDHEDRRVCLRDVADGTAYNGIAVASVTVNIEDNDTNEGNEGNFADSGGGPTGTPEGGVGFGNGGSRGRRRILALGGPIPAETGHYRITNVAHQTNVMDDEEQRLLPGPAGEASTSSGAGSTTSVLLAAIALLLLALVGRRVLALTSN
jgi:hypothetical protein